MSSPTSMETATERVFSYNLIPLRLKLSEIRLLEVFPAPDFGDDLRCRLYTVLIEEPPQHSGDGLPCSICSVQHPSWYINLQPRYGRDACQGCGLTKHCQTTFGYPWYQALSCLRQLRSSCRSESLTIWIDQVCIDQSNDQEKSVQVELMRKIYSTAARVVIWLGPAADGSDDVMEAHSRVWQIVREYHLPAHRQGQSLHDHLVNTLDHDGNLSLPNFQRFRDEVARIYDPLIRDQRAQRWIDREWFSRIWVVQELSLSRDAVFMCGDKSLDSGYALVSLKMFKHILWRLVHLLNKLYNYDQTPLRTSSKYRDRIYGLLGLVWERYDYGLRPDYSNQTTTTMVLTQTARALIKRGGVNLLSLVQFPKQGVAHMEDGTDEQFPLPSRVPDWYARSRQRYRIRHGRALESLSASWDAPVQLIPTVLQSTIGLRGFFVDTVEEVGGYIEDREFSSETEASRYWQEVADSHAPLCSIKRFWRQSAEKEHHEIYSNAARRNEALWRVPIGDLWQGSDEHEPSGFNTRPPRELIPYMSELFDLALEYSRIAMSISHQVMLHTTPDVEFVPSLSQAEKEVVKQAENSELMNQYLDRLQDTLDAMHLRPYLTKKGYLGLAPTHTQPGDHLVIFSGGLVPYVIRPVTTDTDRYRFKPGAGSQANKSDEQSRVDSTTTGARQDVKDCHEPNFKLPETPLYTKTEIHTMYERYNLHQASRPPPEPVALPTRPDENDSIYTFVGEAFCDGIMDGEFMERAGEIQDFFLV
ncbi:heterokaryon incompatibility protein-domain-containing protein [Sordaria brevicollis]|uniref:Heterokaryon incompatibility protein-domain-containing protein n=1 Tax=Sordaria brevicollis TaxID=83679 RepID=A0AAE0PLY7_SORBR|nr:heterokaryon incompatibility protein-domain-containing protein [Sordaria brevicollis]